MSIVKVNFFSASLKRNVNFIGVLPVEKRSPEGICVRSKDKPMKALYLLHGIHGSEYDWITETRVKRWASKRDLAVFMPAGENAFYNDNEGLYLNMATYVGKELVEFTRSMFRLSDKREDTYIAGLSMGGYGALCTGMRYPETFSHIGAFSAGLINRNPPQKDYPAWEPGNRSYFENMLKASDNFKQGENDYFFLADKLMKSGQPVPKIYMSCGLSDGLLESNREFKDYLLELGYPVDYFEDEGAHEWDFWDRHLLRFLEWLPLGEQ